MQDGGDHGIGFTSAVASFIFWVCSRYAGAAMSNDEAKTGPGVAGVAGVAGVTRGVGECIAPHVTDRLRQAMPAATFALLVGSVVDYAIYMLDVDGYIVSWNAGAERIKGYAAQDVVGRHFSLFYTAD